MPDFLAELLYKPGGEAFVLAIKTALTWGRTPMQVLLPEHTRAEINDLDYDAIANADINMMTAWQVLKDETCPRCGIPSWIGHVADRWTQFEVRETTCFSCQAVEQFDDKQREHNKDDKRQGTVSYPVPYRVKGAPGPMPSRIDGLKAIMEQDEADYGEPGESP